MVMLVTREGPDFKAKAVRTHDPFEEITPSSSRGGHVLLAFHPLDFTCLCPAGLIAFDQALDQFKGWGVEVIAVSVDSHRIHHAWKNTPREHGGIVRHALANDLSLDRSIDAALRIVDALKFTEEQGEVCPASRHPGQEALPPTAKGVASCLARHAR